MNELCCVDEVVDEQNSIVSSVCVDDWTAEWVIIASVIKFLFSAIERENKHILGLKVFSPNFWGWDDKPP